MLVLTRQIGSSLKIGSNVDVTVLGINGNQVRIGVLAPPDVQVLRDDAVKRSKGKGR